MPKQKNTARQPQCCAIMPAAFTPSSAGGIAAAPAHARNVGITSIVCPGASTVTPAALNASIERGQMFEVKATDGDTHLGGDDFDQVIIDPGRGQGPTVREVLHSATRTLMAVESRHQPTIGFVSLAEVGRGVVQTVGVEQQAVAAPQIDMRFVEVAATDTQRRCRNHWQLLDAAVSTAEQRHRMAGTGDIDPAPRRIQDRSHRSHEHAALQFRAHLRVEQAQQVGGVAGTRRDGTQVGTDASHQQRSRKSLAGHVADEEQRAPVGERQEVEQVAADDARGGVAVGDLVAVEPRRRRRQEPALDAAGHLEVVRVQQTSAFGVTVGRDQRTELTGAAQQEIGIARHQRFAVVVGVEIQHAQLGAGIGQDGRRRCGRHARQQRLRDRRRRGVAGRNHHPVGAVGRIGHGLDDAEIELVARRHPMRQHAPRPMRRIPHHQGQSATARKDVGERGQGVAHLVFEHAGDGQQLRHALEELQSAHHLLPPLDTRHEGRHFARRRGLIHRSRHRKSHVGFHHRRFRQRHRVDRRVFGWRRRRCRRGFAAIGHAHAQARLTEFDRIAIVQPDRRQQHLAVVARAVRTLQIAQQPGRTFGFDLGMAARHREVGDHQIGKLPAPEHGAVRQRESLT